MPTLWKRSTQRLPLPSPYLKVDASQISLTRLAKIKSGHFILIFIFKLELPPRRAHVMFHHLISGEMLDGCVRPLAILHNSVFSTYSALWCSVVSGTIRTVVVSVTVMGSWEPGLSRSPPKPTDSSAWTRTKQEGNQTNDF